MHAKPAISESRLFHRYPANEQGRDFGMGDIHGEIDLVRRLLDRVAFNPEIDRLFAAGDLVDRGPDSMAVLDLLKKCWFHSVRGNHDQWCNDHVKGQTNVNHAIHGGKWFYDLTPEVQQEVAAVAVGLPIAIEVEARDGRKFGFVHAEVQGEDWDQFRTLISNATPRGKPEELLRWVSAIHSALDSRDRIQSAADTVIQGIDLVFAGHNTISDAARVGNRVYLDTGSGRAQGKLTIIELTTLQTWTERKNPREQKVGRQ